MNEILKQLGELVLGSVPTMALFILLVIAYEFLVRRPMGRILIERHARTTGAVEQARSAISSAEAETLMYEEKLRAAKAEIFRLREKKLKQWNAERESALAEVRVAMQKRVLTARLDIEQGLGAARQQVESLGAELGAQVAQAVLPKGVVSPEAAQ